MVKMTPEVAQALVNLRTNHDFSIFLAWIEQCEAKATATCTKHDGLLLYRAQGAVEHLSGIREAVLNAPTNLQKFKSSHQPPVQR